MSQEENKDLNNVSSSSSSVVGPGLAGLGFHPIFSQPRLMPAFNNAKDGGS
jgi:hypothetical protein